jgi:hypothetical protein
MPTTTLEQFHTAVTDAMRAWFGSRVQQVGAYDPASPFGEMISTLETPALLFAVEAHELADEDLRNADPLTRLPRECDCSILCVLSVAEQPLHPLIAINELTGAVAALIHAQRTEDATRRGNRWGLGDAVGWPGPDSAAPADQSLHGRLFWRVAWRQRVYLDGSLPG